MYKTFSESLMHWTWPTEAKVKTKDMADIFSAERTKSSRKAKHLKCSASDCWNMMAPLKAFVHEVLLNLYCCKAECNVFLQFVEIVDLVTATPRTHVEPAILFAKIQVFWKSSLRYLVSK